MVKKPPLFDAQDLGLACGDWLHPNLSVRQPLQNGVELMHCSDSLKVTFLAARILHASMSLGKCHQQISVQWSINGISWLHVPSLQPVCTPNAIKPSR